MADMTAPIQPNSSRKSSRRSSKASVKGSLRNITNPQDIRELPQLYGEIDSKKPLANKMFYNFLKRLPDESDTTFWGNTQDLLDEDDTLPALFQAMRVMDISQDTLIRMFQFMYFAEDRVYLIVPPMQNAQAELVKPSHESINHRGFGNNAVNIDVELQLHDFFLEDWDDEIMIPKGIVILSSDNPFQLTTNLANTGKSYASLMYRVWFGVFNGVYQGITYKELITFILEVKGKGFNHFIADWGLYAKNEWFQNTSTLTTESKGGFVPQFFDSRPDLTRTQEIGSHLTALKSLLKAMGVATTIADGVSSEHLATRHENGFFAVPHKPIWFFSVLLANGLLVDVDVTFTGGKLSIIELLHKEYKPNYLKKATLNRSYDVLKNSFSKVVNSPILNKNILSPNLRGFINDEDWYESEDFYTKVVTMADMVLVLSAIFTHKDINDLKRYGYGEIELNDIHNSDYNSIMKTIKEFDPNPTYLVDSRTLEESEMELYFKEVIQKEVEFLSKVEFDVKEFGSLMKVNESTGDITFTWGNGTAKEITIEDVLLGVLDINYSTTEKERERIYENLNMRTLKFNLKVRSSDFILRILKAVFDLF